MFEMACGYELSQLVPGEVEYKAVQDRAVRDILELIFEREGGVFSSSLEQVNPCTASYFFSLDAGILSSEVAI